MVRELFQSNYLEVLFITMWCIWWKINRPKYL